MKLTLFVAYVEDDRIGAFSWVLADYYTQKVNDGVYVITSKAKNNLYRAFHLGLRRALRQVAARPEPIDLTIVFDDTTCRALAFELLGVEPPKNQGLYNATTRVLKRFRSYELAAFSDESDLRPEEAAAIDNGLNILEQLEAAKGRFELLKWRLIAPQKIIN